MRDREPGCGTARYAAVADDHVRHGERLIALGLEDDRIVPRVEGAVLDHDVRRLDVDAVVRPVRVAEARKPPHRHAVAVPEVASPRPAVPVGEALEPQVPAAREAHHDRQLLRLALAGELAHLAERPALSVQHAFPDDRDVRRVLGEDEIPLSFAHPRIVGEIRARRNDCALLKLERHVRPQDERLRRPLAPLDNDRPAASSRRVNPRLEIQNLPRLGAPRANRAERTRSPDEPPP